jgi:hypothetical protein
VIHGNQIGADLLAGQWAKSKGLKVAWYRADWHGYGKAAGPVRNARIVAEGKPHLVVAFPGGKGTADMIAKAKGWR